jgi:hypothetical protein
MDPPPFGGAVDRALSRFRVADQPGLTSERV